MITRRRGGGDAGVQESTLRSRQRSQHSERLDKTSYQSPKTIRQEIIESLRQGPLTALELSQLIKVSEKEVVKHLPHVAKSTVHNCKLSITPARCEACGFAFSKRTRFSRPGRCPRCKSERITAPAFSIH